MYRKAQKNTTKWKQKKRNSNEREAKIYTCDNRINLNLPLLYSNQS